MMHRTLCAAASVAALVALAGCFGASQQDQSAAGGGAAATTYRIAVIPKGTTHEFWKSIHAGAVKAERELTSGDRAVEVTWKGPLKEDDRNGQIEVVESFINQQYDGIVLAPLDDRALVRPVETAVENGVPVVIIDSGLQTDAYVSFVATDNYKGGYTGGERLGELLGGTGKVILLRYQEGSASTEQREAGFLAAIEERYPDIEIISENQYAGATRDTANQAAQNLLNQHHEEVDGIFTPNESSTAGMLIALRDARQQGLVGDDVVHVGFDASPILVEALRGGEIQGLVVQDPFNMGYLGVKTMVAHLDGEQVDGRIDTGSKLLTPENIDQPEFQRLIDPPLDQYLQ